MSPLAIEVRDLRMQYGTVEAARGIDCEVITGEGFGRRLDRARRFAAPAGGVAGLVVAARRLRWVPQAVGA